MSLLFNFYKCEEGINDIFNVRAENVDLEEEPRATNTFNRFKEAEQSRSSQTVRINEFDNDDNDGAAAPAINVDEDLLKDLETEIMSMFAEQEEEKIDDSIDYLDFDTDVITITMESEIPTSAAWNHPGIRDVRRRLVRHRPIPPSYYRYAQRPHHFYYQY